jgi:two-component system response regulator MtrA
MMAQSVTPSSAHVLIVDDDSNLAEMMGIALTQAGFGITVCGDGPTALEEFARVNPDLVLLDVMLPGIDGIEVCRRIREISGTPIVMITAKNDDTDVVAGLEMGADDYIVKPCATNILIARVRARLRPSPGPAGVADTLDVEDVVIDTLAHRVTRDGREINLTPLEFTLLVTLASQPQRVLSREELLEQVWGYQYKADTRLVNVHVQRLRSKVEHDPDDPRIVRTVRGVGYRAGGD